MKTKGPRSRQFKMSLIATLVILLTIPLAIYSLLQDFSFDPSSDASEITTPIVCTISFPFVSPLSIAEDNQVQLRLIAEELGGETEQTYEDILRIEVSSQLQGALLSKEYAIEGVDDVTIVQEPILYSANKKGIDTITGIVTSVTPAGEEIETECVVITPLSANKITVLAANNAPFFSSSPNSAVPSNNIKDGLSYKYVVKASDPEGDDISFHASFTPGADWMTISVVKDGKGGELELKFEGVADVPASYLANVFIHDGYNQHLRSQSWAISVSPSKNDIPIVTVSEPGPDTSVQSGQDLQIVWEAEDLNQIVGYKLYYSTNPGNKDTWVLIDGLSHKFGTYIFDTTGLETGNYAIIVEATDNQDPAAIGFGVSELFGVNKGAPGSQDPGPDDGPVLTIPQIIEVSPKDGSTIKNRKATISATLIAGKGATIDTTSIKMELDNKDISSQIELAKQSESEYRVLYKPEDDLSSGEHQVKVEFEDSDGDSADKTWSFTVEGDDDEVYTIFGFDIPKRTATIIGVGILILLAALIVPWLLYLAWRNSDDDDYTPYSTGGFGDDSPTYTPTPYEPPSTDPVATTETTTSYDTSSFSTGVGSLPPVEVEDVTPVEPSTEVAYTPPQEYQPQDFLGGETSQSYDYSQPTPEASVDNPPKQEEASTLPVVTAASADSSINPPAQPEEVSAQGDELTQLAQALEESKKDDPYSFLDENKPKS